MAIVYITRSVVTEEQVEAVIDVHRSIVTSVADEVRVNDPPSIIELDEVPYGVIRRTQPLIFEHPSWGAEDAAPPVWLSDRQIEQCRPSEHKGSSNGTR